MSRKTTPHGRRLKQQSAWQRQRHQSVNPVTEAVAKANIHADIERLRTKESPRSHCKGKAMTDKQLMQDAYDALCVAFPGRQVEAAHGINDQP